MILRNHGLLSCGSSVSEAFYFMYMLNRACEMQVAALSGNQEILEIPPQTLQLSFDEADKLHKSDGLGKKDFDALVRMLDRQNPSYRL
jgi:ribulose-5-phosphate 4-epimerase/fuculose-1-phosphate aldolase